MKTVSKNIFSFLFALCMMLAFTIDANAQTAATPKKGQQTITLKVPGVCGMCKERIESAAMDVAGVKKAEWDIQTDTLVVVGSAKMSKQKVAEALAKAGYRSDVCAADAKAYEKLPGCCQYDSGLEKH